jgi:hypothetical protein
MIGVTSEVPLAAATVPGHAAQEIGPRRPMAPQVSRCRLDSNSTNTSFCSTVPQSGLGFSDSNSEGERESREASADDPSAHKRFLPRPRNLIIPRGRRQESSSSNETRVPLRSLSPMTPPAKGTRTVSPMTPPPKKSAVNECSSPVTPPPKRPADRFRSPSPRANPCNHSPPPAPWVASAHRELREDVDAAVESKSMAFLCVSYRRVHSCCEDHCLHEAVRRNHPNAVRFILEHEPRTVSVDGHCGGMRPLHLALQRCALGGERAFEMAELLLKHGAQPNWCEGDVLQSPLTLACKFKQIPLVKLLLKKGACPFQRDNTGRLPRSYAAHAEMNTLLTQAEKASVKCTMGMLQHSNSKGGEEVINPGSLLACVSAPGIHEMMLSLL